MRVNRCLTKSGGGARAASWAEVVAAGFHWGLQQGCSGSLIAMSSVKTLGCGRLGTRHWWRSERSGEG